MMQEIMSHVVTHVSENTATICQNGSMPIVENHGVRKFVEGNGKDNEQRRRQDQPVPIHWQVVVNAVEKEVKGDSNTVIGQPSDIICQRD